MPLLSFVRLAFPLGENLYRVLNPAGQKRNRNQSIHIRAWEKSWLLSSKDLTVALMHAKFPAKRYVGGMFVKEIRTGVLVKIEVFTTRGLFAAEGAMTAIFPTQKTDCGVL